MDYTAVGDSSAAGWLVARLTGFQGRVGDTVPEGFEAYVRILHPAGLDSVPVRWQDVAEANGRTAHGLMQWDHIVGTQGADAQPGVWDEEPLEGNLPLSLARELAGVLAGHTGTGSQCWFGVWSGWRHLVIAPGETARFEIPDRELFLLAGPLDAVHRTSLRPLPSGDGEGNGSVVSAVATPRRPETGTGALRPDRGGQVPFWRAPNLWWPEDRAWCVATEVDFTSTYIGGTHACIDALLHAPELEAYPAHPGDTVTEDSDRINPPPRKRR
ncbi:hypothetical protein [Streptomyces sp. ODS28]|uniref:hypothetical protein n=1 Tax=Streptomyces sp. ODS28 TaxID=3136688 RepID=UPI0031E7D293